MLLLWIIYVISVLFCYAFMHVCLLMPCGHLQGKCWPLVSRLWCLFVTLSLSHWYPGSAVVLDCIDSWSLPSVLLLSHEMNLEQLPSKANYLTAIFRSMLTTYYVFVVLDTIFQFDLEKFISKNWKYIFSTRNLYILGENTSKYCSWIIVVHVHAIVFFLKFIQFVTTL